MQYVSKKGINYELRKTNMGNRAGNNCREVESYGRRYRGGLTQTELPIEFVAPATGKAKCVCTGDVATLQFQIETSSTINSGITLVKITPPSNKQGYLHMLVFKGHYLGTNNEIRLFIAPDTNGDIALIALDSFGSASPVSGSVELLFE